MGTRKAIAVGVLAVVAVVAALWGAGVLPRPAVLGGESSDAGAGPEPFDADALPAGDEDETAEPGLAVAPPRMSMTRQASGAVGGAGGAGDGAKAPPVGLAGSVVRADGKPAARATVVATGAFGRVVEATADADGRFRLEADAGRWDLVFRAGSDGALLVRGFRVDGSALTAPFRLGGASEIRVEVKRKGEPVAGAEVEARLAYGDVGDKVVAGTTDAQGAFLAPGVPSGPYRVAVVPPGQDFVVMQEMPIIPPLTLTRTVEVSGDVVVSFDLPPTVRVSGRITDAATHAGVWAGVEVVIVLGDSTVTGWTISERDGAYAVQVPAGRVRSFRVDDWEHAPFPAAEDVKALFEALAPIRQGKDVVKDVALASGSRLAGTVTTGPDKTPVPGLWLRFENKAGQVLRTAPTNVMGGYLVLALPAGEVVVTLESAGWYLTGDGRKSVAVPPASEGRETTLDLEVTASSTVTGVVVGADGAPIRGVTVRVVGGGLAGSDARRVGRVLETATGTDGRFALTEVPPAVDVRVEAALGETKSAPTAAFRLPEGDPSPLRLVLTGTGRIAGRVIDLVTRAPVAGARVRVDPVGEPAGRGSRATTTSPEGRFDVGGLLPGGWRLTPNLRRGEYLPGEPRDVELGTDLRDVIVELTPDPGRVVAGTVLDAPGAPLPGVRLVLAGTPDGGAGTKPIERRAGTDREGRFRIAALASGAYALTASRRGFLPVEVRSLRGGEERLVLRLAVQPPAAGGENK